MEELKRLDAKEGVQGIIDVENCEREEVRSQVAQLLSLEEISWRQKLRILCTKEGDNNTKFFHKMANARRRYNHLGILEVNGVLHEEETEVASQIVRFYQKLYQETKVWRPREEGLDFEQIGELDRGWMERQFDREEILVTIQDL